MHVRAHLLSCVCACIVLNCDYSAFGLQGRLDTVTLFNLIFRTKRLILWLTILRNYSFSLILEKGGRLFVGFLA